MDLDEKDEISVLYTEFQSDDHSDSTTRGSLSRTRSASVSISSRTERPTSFVQMSATLFVSHNREVIFQPPPLPTYGNMDNNGCKIGQLGICNDPNCITCPTYCHVARTSERYDAKFHNMIYGDAKGWAKRMCSFLKAYIPGVMNPHTRVVQQWNKFFMISCLFAVFIDPLFCFVLSVEQDHKCVILNGRMTRIVVVLRSITDFIYLLHILLQFRLAYVIPKSGVVGAGDFVDDPKKIAKNYFFGYFFIDLFVVLPIPQIITLTILTDAIGPSGAIYAKDLLNASILVPFVPKMYRLFPLFASSATGFIFELGWANFFINLLTYVLASHIVGSFWYLFRLQRVNHCLLDACHDSKITGCLQYIDCRHGNDNKGFQSDPLWDQWKINDNVTACFGQNALDYGIYRNLVNLTTHQNVATRYIYSLFWGFQQISTLAGNQVPSYAVWEVLFTMWIIASGLLLLTFLIGNMQNFLQGLGRRSLEMSLRRRDIEQWMSHRHLPKDLRSKVRIAEHFNWAVTRGVNEERLMENLPEDLQRDIRRHLFEFVKKIRIFQHLDEPIIDGICERLRTKTYIKGSNILQRGDLIDKMVFIIRGKMESVGEDQIAVPLSEGDVCGEELVIWWLEHSSVFKAGKRLKFPGDRLLSNRSVRCLTNVEAVLLRATDIKKVTSVFSRFLHSPLVEGATRYESTNQRGVPGRRVQVAWRHRKKRLRRGDSKPIT